MVHLEAWLCSEHPVRPSSHWMAILLCSPQPGWIASTGNLENVCNDCNFTKLYTQLWHVSLGQAQGAGQVSCLHQNISIILSELPEVRLLLLVTKWKWYGRGRLNSQHLFSQSESNLLYAFLKATLKCYLKVMQGWILHFTFE